MKYLSSYLFLLLGAGSANAQTYTLTVEVRGFRNTAGTVKLNAENSRRQQVFKKIEALSATTWRTAITGLAKGQYAVNIIHDKNNNNKLDTNWLGIPKEGWGCSNDARGFMGAPSFKDKLVDVNANKTIIINLVHY